MNDDEQDRDLLRAQLIALATNARLVAYPDENAPGVVYVYAKDVELPEGKAKYIWIGVAFPPDITETACASCGSNSTPRGPSRDGKIRCFDDIRCCIRGARQRLKKTDPK